MCTSDCVEVVTKHFHGKLFTQLFYPGRALQCPEGARVFVTDVTAPNKSHYLLTARLRVDTGRLWLTYELDPLLKDANKKKVPQFSVTSEATHLSSEQMAVVMTKANDALPVLYEATFGRRGLDLIPGAGRSAVLSLPPVLLLIPAPSPGASAQVSRPMDDAYDLQIHVGNVAQLTQQVLQLRAQQLLTAEALAAMRTAKDLADQALTAEKTRKAGSADSGPCKKKQCKTNISNSTAHGKCNSAYQQKVHQKSHDLHQACAGAAAEQCRQINKLKADNTSLADEMQVLRDEHETAAQALKQEVAEAKQQAAKVEARPNSLSVTEFGSVITSFAENAKKLIPVPNTAPRPAVAPAPPASASTFTVAQLLELKSVFN